MTAAPLSRFEIRRETRDVMVDGSSVPLGARAFDVLAYLDAYSDRVVSKRELLDHVWGGLSVEEGNLTVQISALRKVLGGRAIATVPGVGYNLTPAAAPLSTAEGPSLPDFPSLAVLPFANITGQPDQDYLVDGIVTDLIAALTRVPGLFVIASTSSFRYRGRAVDLADVGRELGVRHVLEGLIQQAAASLRITVQLVEAASGRAFWSERFSGPTDDIFDLQDRIAECVAAAIEPTLRSAEALRLREKPQQDLRAYDLCLRAEPNMRPTSKPEDFRRAIALQDEAVALDPGYAHARALRCRAYNVAASARFIAVADCGVAVADARALLASGSSDPLTLTYAGHTVAYLDQGAEEGLVALRKAKMLNPNSVAVLLSSGWVHAYVGHFDTALADLERALRLNPLDPESGFVHMTLGTILLGLGQIEAAIGVREQSCHEAPTHGSTVFSLVMAYWAAGRMDDARRMGDQLRIIRPDITISETLSVSPWRPAQYRQLIRNAMRGAGIPDQSSSRRSAARRAASRRSFLASTSAGSTRRWATGACRPATRRQAWARAFASVSTRRYPRAVRSVSMVKAVMASAPEGWGSIPSIPPCPRRGYGS
jgi:TolB-like protein